MYLESCNVPLCQTGTSTCHSSNHRASLRIYPRLLFSIDFLATAIDPAKCPRTLRGHWRTEPGDTSADSVRPFRPLVHHAEVNPDSSFQHEVPDALLAQLREGDLEAFERIYRLFERPAYTLALRLTGQHENAQEILQDAMLKAFERADQFRGDAPFWGWLRKLVINEALMTIRKRARFDPAPFDEATLADTAPGPWLKADAQALERALAELPDTARAVLWLYHVEGYTHVEIAEQFDRSVSFSKSQLARGTRRLRELLEPDAVALHGLIHAVPGP